MPCKHCEQDRYLWAYAGRLNILYRQNLLLLYYLIARRTNA